MSIWSFREIKKSLELDDDQYITLDEGKTKVEEFSENTAKVQNRLL